MTSPCLTRLLSLTAVLASLSTASAAVVAKFSFTGSNYTHTPGADPDAPTSSGVRGTNTVLDLKNSADPDEAILAVSDIKTSAALDLTAGLSALANDYDGALGFSRALHSDTLFDGTDQTIFFTITVAPGKALELTAIRLTSLKSRGTNATGARTTHSVFINPNGDPASGLINQADMAINYGQNHFAVGEAGANTTGPDNSTGRHPLPGLLPTQAAQGVLVPNAAQPVHTNLTGTVTIAIRTYGVDAADWGLDEIEVEGTLSDAIPIPAGTTVWLQPNNPGNFANNGGPECLADTDVSTHGTLVSAGRFGSEPEGTTMVNGVPFENVDVITESITGQDVNGAATTGGRIILVGGPQEAAETGTPGVGKYGQLSTSYQKLLGQAVRRTGEVAASIRVNFRELTVGQIYEFQVWTSNSAHVATVVAPAVVPLYTNARSFIGNPVGTDLARGNSSYRQNGQPANVQVPLNFAITTAGGVGGFVRGYFEAAETSHVVLVGQVNGSGTNTTINAVQLRQLPAKPAALTDAGPALVDFNLGDGGTTSVKDITGETDVNTNGTAIAAYNFGGTFAADVATNAVQNVTANGVTFRRTQLMANVTPYNADQAVSSDHRFSISNWNRAGSEVFGDATAGTPYASLSEPFRNLLSSAKWHSGGSNPIVGPVSHISFLQLQPGATYEFQLFANDSRTTVTATGTTQRVVDITDGVTGVRLDENVSDLSGGLGQHVTGRFVAIGTTQTLALTGNNRLMSALQLRLTAPPPVVTGATAIKVNSITYAAGAATVSWTPTPVGSGVDVYRTTDFVTYGTAISTNDLDGTHSDTTAPVGRAFYVLVPTGARAPGR